MAVNRLLVASAAACSIFFCVLSIMTTGLYLSQTRRDSAWRVDDSCTVVNVTLSGMTTPPLLNLPAVNLTQVSWCIWSEQASLTACNVYSSWSTALVAQQAVYDSLLPSVTSIGVNATTNETSISLEPRTLACLYNGDGETLRIQPLSHLGEVATQLCVIMIVCLVLFSVPSLGLLAYFTRWFFFEESGPVRRDALAARIIRGESYLPPASTLRTPLRQQQHPAECVDGIYVVDS